MIAYKTYRKLKLKWISKLKYHWVTILLMSWASEIILGSILRWHRLVFPAVHVAQGWPTGTLPLVTSATWPSHTDCLHDHTWSCKHWAACYRNPGTLAMLALLNLFDTIQTPPQWPFSMNRCMSMSVKSSRLTFVFFRRASQDIPGTLS